MPTSLSCRLGLPLGDVNSQALRQGKDSSSLRTVLKKKKKKSGRSNCVEEKPHTKDQRVWEYSVCVCGVWGDWANTSHTNDKKGSMLLGTAIVSYRIH